MSYESEDRERWLPEAQKQSARTPFARDRARVLHSSALRRLGAKTQVVGPGSDDFARTRLTHSLEVAQVGRELAGWLGCDPDVVDTACLSHDLGHPPFGHHGEHILDGLSQSIGGFEGNAQTLRLLTRLEPKTVGDPISAGISRSCGLNLTRASLDASTKYPWPRGDGPYQTNKFGAYADDLEVFTWLRAGAPSHRKCLEAQVMDLADDIAYSVHDLEDAIVGGWLDPEVIATDGSRDAVVAAGRERFGSDVSDDDFDDALQRLFALPVWPKSYSASRNDRAQLKDLTSYLIGRFVAAADSATRTRWGVRTLTRYDADLVVPPATWAEITALKSLVVAYVMKDKRRQQIYDEQTQILTDLVEVLASGNGDRLETIYKDEWRQMPDDNSRLRIVIDQVASLTDQSARMWHNDLCQGGIR